MKYFKTTLLALSLLTLTMEGCRDKDFLNVNPTGSLSLTTS